MQNNARIGGILSIISGAFGVFWLLIILLVSFISLWAYSEPNTFFDSGTPQEAFTFFVIFYIILGGFYTLVGVMAIVGGVFALRKKNWGVALAGAIAGVITFFPCGIPALIFTALAKPEFNVTQHPAPTAVKL
jgi:hypothetical protein